MSVSLVTIFRNLMVVEYIELGTITAKLFLLRFVSSQKSRNDLLDSHQENSWKLLETIF